MNSVAITIADLNKLTINTRRHYREVQSIDAVSTQRCLEHVLILTGLIQQSATPRPRQVTLTNNCVLCKQIGFLLCQSQTIDTIATHLGAQTIEIDTRLIIYFITPCVTATLRKRGTIVNEVLG